MWSVAGTSCGDNHHSDGRTTWTPAVAQLNAYCAAVNALPDNKI